MCDYSARICSRRVGDFACLALIPAWVCYVYQNRYITAFDNEASDTRYFRLYDFDPLRVRKELYDRKNSPTTATPRKRRLSLLRRASSTGAESVEGDRDGIVVVTTETVIKRNLLLPQGVKTGEKLPYMYVDQETEANVALIDAERIVGVSVCVICVKSVRGTTDIRSTRKPGMHRQSLVWKSWNFSWRTDLFSHQSLPSAPSRGVVCM